MNRQFLFFFLFNFISNGIAQQIDTAVVSDHTLQHLKHICSRIHAMFDYVPPTPSHEPDKLIRSKRANALAPQVRREMDMKYDKSDERYCFAGITFPGDKNKRRFDIRVLNATWLLDEYNKQYNVEKGSFFSLDRFIDWGFSTGKGLLAGVPLLSANTPSILPKLGISQALMAGGFLGIPLGLWTVSLTGSFVLWNMYENRARRKYKEIDNGNDIITYSNLILSEISNADIRRRLTQEKQANDLLRTGLLAHQTEVIGQAKEQNEKTKKAAQDLGEKIKILFGLLDGEDAHMRLLIDVIQLKVEAFINGRLEKSRAKKIEREQEKEKMCSLCNGIGHYHTGTFPVPCKQCSSCNVSTISSFSSNSSSSSSSSSGSFSSTSTSNNSKISTLLSIGLEKSLPMLKTPKEQLDHWKKHQNFDEFNEKTIKQWFIATSKTQLPEYYKWLWCSECGSLGNCTKCKNTELVCITMQSGTKIVQRRSIVYEPVQWSENDAEANKGLCRACKNIGYVMTPESEIDYSRKILCKMCEKPGFILYRSAGGHETWTNPPELEGLPKS